MLCAQTRTDPLLRQRAAGAYQLPRKLATDPLSPAAVMVHDIRSDIVTPQALSKGMHTEQRSLLEATALRLH